jgi:hypothetical protein
MRCAVMKAGQVRRWRTGRHPQSVVAGDDGGAGAQTRSQPRVIG